VRANSEGGKTSMVSNTPRRLTTGEVLTASTLVVIGFSAPAFIHDGRGAPTDAPSKISPENTISIEGDCRALAPHFSKADGQVLKVTMPEGCSIRFPAIESPRP
jgi:hypothetical protein